MKRLVLFLFSSGMIAANAQPTFLDLLRIPDSVRKNASVIKQYERQYFEITDVEHSSFEVQQVYTIMGEEGKGRLVFQLFSSKYMSIDEAEIKVYDLAGKQTARYRKKEMSTVANGEGLIEDGFVTYFVVPSSSYPITVEYNYKYKFKGTRVIPKYVINTSGESVVNSTYIAKVPKDLDIRYKSINTKLSPDIKDDGKNKVYQWTVNNIPAVEYEYGSSDKPYPVIEIAPTRFSYYGSEGQLTSWKDFGLWLSTLYNGLDVLPEDRKQFFRNMVKDANEDKEKARIIYDYLQKNFRYVSIQLGIGGIKPFSADFTDKKKYGDCKGLSNYMKAALGSVGVRSHVAIINAQYNSEPVDPNFPQDDFNHVILCIPQPKDSIWLECTSSTTDFGVLGTFTENRNALLITETGGALVPTPKSKFTDNRFYTTSTVVLAEDGSGKTNTAFTTCGEYKEILESVLKDKDDDRKEYLVNSLGFKQPDVFSLTENKNAGDYVVNLDMEIQKIPEFKAGSKMFINPRLYKLFQQSLPKAQNRRLDYYFRFPFEKMDTTIFKLPEGYVPDALPGAKEVKCDLASYSTKYWFDEKERSVYCTSKLVLQQNKIPAAKYASVKTFFDDVLLDANQKLVIKKN
jgi:Domain of Unknown Function with PDB structure (DUF3857)/Transglutaminase-like superfamily